MKSSKLIVVFSELSSHEQLISSKISLVKGLEQLNNKFPLSDILDGVENSNIQNNIELKNCDIEVILNAKKDEIVSSITESMSYNNVFLLYVGEVTTPFGQWILHDGVFYSSDLLSLFNGNKIKDNFVFVTSAPCEDWQIIEKKQVASFNLCCFNIEDNILSDELFSGMTNFVEGIVSMLKITPIYSPKLNLATIASRNPSLYLFHDKGSAAVPALLTLDGFNMIFNFGFNRNPECKRYLKYYQQIDVALLSHIGYNNFLGLKSYTDNKDGNLQINHLFFPGEVNVSDKAAVQSNNPFIIDLKCHLNAMVGELKNQGMQCSNLTLKGKVGQSLTANQVKPIPLFHKIGYGSLEMIPLTPFEDDADSKKFLEDWKKSKYLNDSVAKYLPNSVSILIIWKPFNTKLPVKRILYIGSKCPLKKCWPAVITTLYNSYEYLKQSEYCLGEGLIKKSVPRKGTSPVATAAQAVNKHSKVGDTVSTNQSAASNTKKPSEKTTRPATSGPTNVSKEASLSQAKRPQTATTKSKTEVPKVTDTKKNVTGTNSAPKSSTTLVNKKQPIKKPDLKNNVKELMNHEIKKKPEVTSLPNGTHKDKTIGNQSDKKGTKVIQNHSNDGNVELTKYDEPLSSVDPIMDNDFNDELEENNINTKSDCNKVVAVGTVECAITEHGEADFCAETPEELSADQMKAMGLSDDDEDDKVRSSVMCSGDNQMTESGTANLAHLPMEGSFYGKETVDVNDSIDHANWSQPLAMPMPVKDSGNAAKKTAVKCPTRIYVDCVCVPSDLDREDLHYLLECVKFKTAFLQLDQSSELIKTLEILLEEREKDKTNELDGTIIPSIVDETFLYWQRENNARLEACRLAVTTDLTRRIITTGEGDKADDSSEEKCCGMKWEF